MLFDALIAREERVRWQSTVVEAIYDSYNQGVPFMQTSISKMVEQTDESANEKIATSILTLLEFQEITDRRQRIPEAHKKTLEWIFDGNWMMAKKFYVFSDWLQNDERLYWITGKAGSGKSTLMKFIYGHPKTHSILTQSNSRQNRFLVLAAFFFWNSGRRIQMSQEGLLRTLLHEVLQQCQDLIPQVVPHRWEAFRLFGQDTHPWSWSEIVRAFKSLLEMTCLSHKFVFIIDGLDEFEGDHTDLIDWVRDLVTWPHVKACVSSRPWIVFEDAFKNNSSLTMQDMTYRDIKIYVRDQFSSNKGFSILQAAEPDYAAKLVESVTTKASGVFLWVFLVVRSLLSGLTSGDRISDLEAKLNSLPPDLETLFWKMLKSSGTEQFERASQLIQLVRVVPQPRLLELAFADEDEQRVFDHPSTPLNEHEREARAEIMRRRIDHICKGLLEVAPGQLLPEAKVEYLHRTVKDFLEQESIDRKIFASTKSDFNAHAAWCRSCIMQLKVSDAKTLSIHSFWREVRTCLEFLEMASFEGYKRLSSIYDALDNAAGSLASRETANGLSLTMAYGPGLKAHWTATRPDCYSSRSFLNFAVQCGLLPYVAQKLGSGRLDLNAGQTPLLYSALCAYQVFLEAKGKSAVQRKEAGLEMVELLLRHGADPNVIVLNESIWRRALCNASVTPRDSRGHLTSAFNNIEYQPSRYQNLEDATPKRYTSKWDDTYHIRDADDLSVELNDPNENNTDLEQISAGSWVKIFKLCLEYGARPQDALELLSDKREYVEVLDLAKQCMATKQASDSELDDVRKGPTTTKQEISSESNEVEKESRTRRSRFWKGLHLFRKL